MVLWRGFRLFYDLIPSQQDRRRDREAKRRRGFKTPHELELGQLLDRHVDALGAQVLGEREHI